MALDFYENDAIDLRCQEAINQKMVSEISLARQLS